MSLSRRNPKRDAIERPCIELLEKAGWCVLQISAKYGPDAIAAKAGVNVCFEFKGQKRKDQPKQDAWRQAWPGTIATIYSVEELQTWLSGPAKTAAR